MPKHFLDIIDGSAMRSIFFDGTVRLIELLENNAIPICAPCSGNGKCGGCAVDISGETLPPDPSEQKILAERSLHGKRLACRVTLTGNCKLKLNTPPISIEITDAGHNCTGAVIGAAIDIGTTTINAALIDLRSKDVLCRMSELNFQRLYGADVMTRISACSSGCLDNMHKTIVIQINTMLSKAMQACGAADKNIDRIAMAGNTVMLHLAAGYDPTVIGSAPYMPEEFFGRVFSADETGLVADAYFMPCVSGFIGGDLIACLTAEELPENHLLCDLGTNGETALRRNGKYYTASAAAGPALEGGGIACGSGAVSGAVSHLWESGDKLHGEIIGSGRAKTLCGSAIISAAAILLKKNVFDPSGRMTSERYELIDDTFITAKDIRELQLAKGAVAAAMLRVSEVAGASPDDISQIVLTGGLGCYADIPSICEIGLVPASMSGSVTARPALALKGACLCLFDEGKARAKAIAGECINVPLGGDARFDELFIENIPFSSEDE